MKLVRFGAKGAEKPGLVDIRRKGGTDAAEYRPLRPWDR